MIVIGGDPSIRRQTGEVARFLGLTPVYCQDDATAIERMRRDPVTLVVLVCETVTDSHLHMIEHLHENGAEVVVVLGSRIDARQRAEAIRHGAKDVMSRPFENLELEYRLRRVAFQKVAAEETRSRTGRVAFVGFVLDRAERALAAPDGTAVELTGMAFDLLDLLTRHPNRTLARDWILRMLRQRESVPEGRALEMVMSRLRAALEPHLKGRDLIKTVRGEGYVFAARVEEIDAGALADAGR